MGWDLRFRQMLRFIVLEITEALLLNLIFFMLTFLLFVIFLIAKPVEILVLIVWNHWAVHFVLNHAVECIKVICFFCFLFFRRCVFGKIGRWLFNVWDLLLVCFFIEIIRLWIVLVLEFCILSVRQNWISNFFRFEIVEVWDILLIVFFLFQSNLLFCRLWLYVFCILFF